MIVVAGEALVDLVIAADGSVVAALGGGPYNTARTIARLGGSVAFLGAVSGDRFGSLIREQLVADGVDDSLVQLVDLPTTLAAAELGPGSTARYRFYAAGTSAPSLRPVPLPGEVAVLHVGSLGLVLEPMAVAIEELLAGLSDAVLVFVDLNCRPAAITDRTAYLARIERVLRRADVVKVSTEDLDYLGSGAGIAAVRRRDDDTPVVLVTDGDGAVQIHRGSRQRTVEVPTVDVVDTIGAGDAFGGAFVAWWVESGRGRGDLDDDGAIAAAVTAAVDVAAISCCRRGADPPRRVELSGHWPGPPRSSERR